MCAHSSPWSTGDVVTLRTISNHDSGTAHHPLLSMCMRTHTHTHTQRQRGAEAKREAIENERRQQERRLEDERRAGERMLYKAGAGNKTSAARRQGAMQAGMLYRLGCCTKQGPYTKPCVL
eukprot:1154132-Pelagomonas_calceolata.AAC.4